MYGSLRYGHTVIYGGSINSSIVLCGGVHSTMSMVLIMYVSLVNSHCIE